MSALSDHMPVYYIRQSKVKNVKTNMHVKKRIITSSGVTQLKDKLSQLSWDTIINENNPETSYKSFCNILSNNFDECFPEKNFKPNRKSHALNPWFSKGLLISRNTKNKLASKLISKPSNYIKEKYKFYNSIYTKLVRKAKLNYFHLQFQTHYNNMRKTWSTINDILGKSKKNNNIPDYFKKGSKVITGSQDIAEEFNNF